MDGERAVFCNGGKVGGGGIAFVLGEAVFGVEFIERVHGAITGDFGEDGRGGDGEAFGIAFYYGGEREADVVPTIAVDEEVDTGIQGLGFGIQVNVILRRRATNGRPYDFWGIPSDVRDDVGIVPYARGGAEAVIYSAFHGQKCGVSDVELVDFSDGGKADSIGGAVFGYIIE